jgi:hypothetical protein
MKNSNKNKNPLLPYPFMFRYRWQSPLTINFAGRLTQKRINPRETNQVKGSIVLLNFVLCLWLKKTQLNVFQYANFTVALNPDMGVVFVKSVNYGSQLLIVNFPRALQLTDRQYSQLSAL